MQQAFGQPADECLVTGSYTKNCKPLGFSSPCILWAQCNGPDTTIVDWEDTNTASCCDIKETVDHKINCVACAEVVVSAGIVCQCRMLNIVGACALSCIALPCCRCNIVCDQEVCHAMQTWPQEQKHVFIKPVVVLGRNMAWDNKPRVLFAI